MASNWNPLYYNITYSFFAMTITVPCVKMRSSSFICNPGFLEKGVTPNHPSHWTIWVIFVLKSMVLGIPYETQSECEAFPGWTASIQVQVQHEVGHLRCMNGRKKGDTKWSNGPLKWFVVLRCFKRPIKNYPLIIFWILPIFWVSKVTIQNSFLLPHATQESSYSLNSSACW